MAKRYKITSAVSMYSPPPRDEKKEYKETYEFAGRHGDKGRTGRVDRDDKNHAAKDEWCYYTQKEKDMLCAKPHGFQGVRKGSSYSKKK